MGLRSGRMSEEQLSEARRQANASNEVHQTAIAANGYNVNRQDRERAQRELTAKLGEKGAKKAMKDAAKSARSGW